MKAFIVLAIAAATAQAGLLGGHEAGSSVSSRSEDGLGNYKFSYKEQHTTGGSFRSEAGTKGVVVGAYGLNDIDGRQRHVEYVADGLGFRAAIKTNEPGTAPAAAAATSIVTPGLAPVVKTIAAAPVVAHASYAAPVAYGHGYGHGNGYGYGYGHY
ncbi:adult-specific rigid cuticular protein 15.5-like [Galendromus occidentalis]|uniref:Adult-specific rigid cuticular protein 15.5-like n=1 Tax=Galendromus occidentalis TaxID=34638 RepID=A0AAJ7SEK8_9ACAR|nr:adult-specific rigid cuticular protein 15.5-like [Galendromus occidentalis]